MRGRGRISAGALTLALALLVLATLPAGAPGGGYVTVGLGSLPDGVGTGETWSADVTILSHGRSPADYLRPVVVIEPLDGESARRFRARPTDRPGVYRAAVAFPTTGRWSYAVDTGWGGVFDFGEVTVATPDRSGLVDALVAALTAAVSTVLGDGGGDAIATRADRPSPAPVGAAERGRQVFAAMGCGSCHRLAAAGSTGELGPPLDERLPAHTPASVRAVIVSPPASMMPDNFGDRLGEDELDALVSFLIAARER